MKLHTCRNCQQRKECGLLSVATKDGAGYEQQRICGDCWESVIMRQTLKINEHGGGGKRVIRGTNSLT
jgi:hypothetical protein